MADDGSALGAHLLRRALQYCRDAALLLSGCIPLVPQRLPELAPRRAELRVVILVEPENLAHTAHLAADVFELAEHRIGSLLVVPEVCAPRVGDAVELLRAFGGDARVTHLLEPGERRVDHAGARAVEAARALFERLDELVAMTRPSGQQSQQHQLQIPGGETAPGSKGPAPHAHAAGEPAGEAPEAAMPVTHEVVAEPFPKAPRAPITEMTVHDVLLVAVDIS